MTVNKKFLILPLVLLFAGRAAAQQELSLSWDEARRLALENNPSVKAAKASASQAGYNYLSSLNSFLPQVNLSNGFSRSGGDSSSPANRWTASISASEDLLNLRTVSSVKSSRISREKAEADYLAASASARQALAGAFTDLLFAQKRVEVQKSILAIREENAKLIRLKYEGGRESKGNALYTEALAGNAAVAVKKTERQLSAAQRSLLQAIGLEGAGKVTAMGIIHVPDFALNEERVSRALEKSPRIISARKTLEAARERTDSARYYAYPTLKASQSYGWSGDREFPQNKSWSMGLTLSLPLFSGGPTYYFNNLSAYKKALIAAQENFKAEKISLSAALRTGYDEFQSAAETAGASAVLLEANKERYSEAQVRYLAGKVSFIDLASLEQNFIDSELSQLDTVRAAHGRKSALEQLLGVGVEE